MLPTRGFALGRAQRVLPLAALALALTPAIACDLCAIYRAADARGEYSSGLNVSLAQQFIPFRTEQFGGTRFERPDAETLDRAITHVVVGWNATETLGFRANLPIGHVRYDYTQVADGFTPVRTRGSDTGECSCSLHASPNAR